MNIMSYPSIPAVLKENAQKYSKKTAISYKKRRGFLFLTYEKFYERILMLARGLRKAGMQPGNTVAIVPREFSIEGGELTPILKMKRKVIYEKYKEFIDELYEANGSGIIAQPEKILLEN